MKHSMMSVENSLVEIGFVLETVTDEMNLLDRRLVLRNLNDQKMLPLAVDFLDPQILHRLKHGMGKNQPLSRAIGVKSRSLQQPPSVFDATAGLGVDAFFIAALGCRVRAVERTSVIARLLADGYRRLQQSENLDTGCSEILLDIASRISFEEGDAQHILSNLTEAERPEVVYLDPMYPDEGRSESALPKKAMQMFRRLVGDDLDANEVFSIARAVAKCRVVVKRPLRAPPLGGSPTHVFKGKTARFDMYICS